MTKESKKDLIADAALACFLTSGYGATSVDEIVKASGISKGGIYWHFKSKEEIFLYLVKRFVNEWNTQYIARLPGTRSAAEKLAIFLEHRLQCIDTPISALMLEFLLQAKEEETIRKMSAEFEKPTHIIYQIIEEAIINGEFKALDPKTVTLSFLAIFDGAGLQMLVHKNKLLLEQTLRTTLEIFLAGVSAEPVKK
ncbi:TetR/AcrR family transcriptional regulator [Desulfotomaculum varum]